MINKYSEQVSLGTFASLMYIVFGST